MLEELYRRLMEKRRREQTTARPQSAASSKRGASVDSDEPYMSDGVVDYGYDAHVVVIVVRSCCYVPIDVDTEVTRQRHAKSSQLASRQTTCS